MKKISLPSLTLCLTMFFFGTHANAQDTCVDVRDFGLGSNESTQETHYFGSVKEVPSRPTHGCKVLGRARAVVLYTKGLGAGQVAFLQLFEDVPDYPKTQISFNANLKNPQLETPTGWVNIDWSDLPQWATSLMDEQQNLLKQHYPIGAKYWADLRAEQKKIQDNQARQKAQTDAKLKADAAETIKFRADIANMNAGQLFAKADELSSQGDTAKARETLRLLLSKFSDHPLAATAAQQMAGMSAASANAANSSVGNNAAANSGVSNVSAQSGGGGNCWDILARKEKEYEALNRRPVPAGATPGLMRVMWMTEDSIKVIDANCAGDAKAAKYRSELVTAYNQAKTACGQMIAGGQCKANAF
jgi:hypothetical protein